MRKTKHTDEQIAFALRPLGPRTRIACGPVFGVKVKLAVYLHVLASLIFATAASNACLAFAI